MADTPHFAYPFQRGANSKVNVVEQGSADHVMSQEVMVALCPVGFRMERPEFGWPFPEFLNPPLDLGPLEAALRRFVPDGTAKAEQYADMADQAVHHIAVTIGTPGETIGLRPFGLPEPRSVPIGDVTPALPWPRAFEPGDTFSRPNQSPLLGGDWGLSINAGTTNRLQVVGGLAKAQADAMCNQCWEDSQADSDQLVTIKTARQTTGRVLVGLYARVHQDATEPDYVGLEVTVGSPDSWALIACIDGVRTVAATATQAVALDDKVGLRVEGPTISAWRQDHADDFSTWTKITEVVLPPELNPAPGFYALATEGDQTAFDNYFMKEI